ncbi:MAG: hypothetical protein H0V17_28320 [Deltaproteobacteria bacterium]|nr:hypothetical protein [Deltaproteobacteria bacterium]
MCMFSGHVEQVSATKIFAGDLADGRQALIYSMTVTVGKPLAMVLPLPVPAHGPEDAVDFVNLDGYADLFTDLGKAFAKRGTYPQAFARSLSPTGMGRLVVHEVGAFVASYVPHSRDFARLDPRFRLPPNILAALPHYADWGFAVFQLDPGKQKEIHPMALRFPRRVPGAIYFPLTHVHDGYLPEIAELDHALYCQVSPLMGTLLEWDPSHAPLGNYVDGSRAHGLIDPAMGGRASVMSGPAPNRDLWLQPPAGLTLDDLSGQGDSFTYRVRTVFHYAWSRYHLEPEWHDTSANKLPALCRGIREGLVELTARNARAWQLGPYSTKLQPYFMNGDQLWIGNDYTTGQRVEEPLGPGRIAFRPFGELVEQQDISLSFAQLPNQDDARAINCALSEMLDQIVDDA